MTCGVFFFTFICFSFSIQFHKNKMKGKKSFVGRPTLRIAFHWWGSGTMTNSNMRVVCVMYVYCIVWTYLVQRIIDTASKWHILPCHNDNMLWIKCISTDNTLANVPLNTFTNLHTKSVGSRLQITLLSASFIFCWFYPNGSDVMSKFKSIVKCIITRFRSDLDQFRSKTAKF